jgi:3',5'-cyclic AMP phosphodiesterase CpdA
VWVDHVAGRIDRDAHDTLLREFELEKPEDPVVIRGDADQLAWIKDTLRSSDADWKIVIGHFPIHSATTGEHGDTKRLISDLQPVLIEEGADLYFSGHDHILQHIQLNGINYFGSGAGAKHHTGVNKSYKGLMGKAEGKFGFMVHEGTPTSLKTTFVQQGGGQPYTYTIRKSKRGVMSRLVESFKLW